MLTHDYLVEGIYWLDRIQPRERKLVGEKACCLGNLAQSGYPVVPGFAIGAPVLRQFLETNNWSEPLFAELLNSGLYLNVDDGRQLQELAQHIRKGIIAAELPQDWIEALYSNLQQWHGGAIVFRPSPSISQTSGLLEAHICRNDPTQLAIALKKTWAEAFRARSLFYWQRMGMQLHQIELAVLVQPVWDAVAAGTLRASPAGLEIKATWGLGVAIATGQVIPDSYQIDPDTGVPYSKKLGNKPIAYHIEGHLERTEQPLGLMPHLEGASMVNLNKHNGLTTYLLDDEKTSRYALEQAYIKDLVKLARDIGSEIGSTFRLEWTLGLADSRGIEQFPLKPQLYLTQVQPLKAKNYIAKDERTVKDNQSYPLPQNQEAHNKEAQNTDNQSYPPSQIKEAQIKEAQIKEAQIKEDSGTTSSISGEIVGVAAASGEAIAPARVISEENQSLEDIPPGQIIVARAIAPDWMNAIGKAAGLVTERGGITSHGAILARELGIPAVVGAAGATKKIKTGRVIKIDGNSGKVYLPAASESISGNQAISIPRVNLNWYGTPILATQLLVNLSQPSALERLPNLPLDGLGLLRSELMALAIVGDRHPLEWIEERSEIEFVEKMAEQASLLARHFSGQPVFYRCLDWRSDEFPSQNLENNPILGQHGAFSYVQNPTLFDLELAVLDKLYQWGHADIRLILPFVRGVEELVFCRHRVEKVGLTQQKGFQLWIMAEVPSVLFLLPEYVKAGAEGIAIGSNDLTQLLLAADRNDPDMAASFDASHIAVRRAIRQLIATAREAGIPCCLCGRLGGINAEAISELVLWGITSISVEPDDLERTYQAISRAEQRLLLEAARRQLS
ncbi:MAG: phosphoenolpyruvate synthase [Oscillatoria sp. SIO1A7]|nr:phosphoenolpyruvate synthase [Oscillatoria sp. SIO1A7]